MWIQFFLINIHFTLNILASLIFFAVFWLYLDAWTTHKKSRELIKIFGFLFLSVSFLLNGLDLNSTILQAPLLNESFRLSAFLLFRISGYILVIVSLLLDPILDKPIHEDSRVAVASPILPQTIPVAYLSLLTPVLAALSGFLYLRRATIGLENHLKPVAFSFFVLSFSELLTIGYLLRNTQNSVIYSVVAPYSYLWMIHSFLLLISTLILRKWIFGYLLKRIQTQLFIVFVSLIVGLFLVVSFIFSGILLRNIESESLNSLITDVKVLEYSIESKLNESMSDSQTLALNPDVRDGIIANDKLKLKLISMNNLVAKKKSIVTILNKAGVVLARGDDPEKIGDSYSGDFLVKRALLGQGVSSVVTKDGALSPVVSIRSAYPVFDGNKMVVGIIMIGISIDNTFVDKMKEATGLNISIYSDNIRSATTFIAPDGKSRWVGVKEENSDVKKQVLLEGKLFSGSINVLNVPYSVAISPLKDVDNNNIGMLFVGREQASIIQTAGKSITITFFATIILIILSVLPAYLVSRYISRQIK